jgi:hypothetical protein
VKAAAATVEAATAAVKAAAPVKATAAAVKAARRRGHTRDTERKKGAQGANHEQAQPFHVPDSSFILDAARDGKLRFGD